MKYSLVQRVLHWLMAILILGLIAVGWYMEGLERGVPNRGELYGLHKSFGMLVLFLVMFRIVVRWRKGAPPLPETLSASVHRAAHIAHYILYGFMVAIPLSGYFMSSFGGYSVKFFGIQLPSVVPENKDIGRFFHEAHGILAYILLAIITLHVAGAIKHRWFDKKENDVLQRML